MRLEHGEYGTVAVDVTYPTLQCTRMGLGMASILPIIASVYSAVKSFASCQR